jgi:NAD(P)-dependent dehydrogenase (short-subunit alcohol dehydrogenase family)
MPVDRRDSSAAQTGGASYPSLRGRSVFITGGGSGIGACLTEAFARQGAKVGFVDYADAPSQTLVQNIETAGLPRPWYRKVDVTDIGALQNAIRDAAKAVGDFHVLINNVANDDRHSLMDVTPEYYDARIAVNQRPAFFAIQAVVPGMKKLGGGSIINFGSISWMTATGGMPAYTTSKAAIHGLTRGLARDLGPFNIRANTVSPGWVMTERQKKLWVTPDAEKQIDAVQCLKGRLQPEDLANMVLYLASDDAKMITSQNFVVDAGWT